MVPRHGLGTEGDTVNCKDENVLPSVSTTPYFIVTIARQLVYMHACL